MQLLIDYILEISVNNVRGLRFLLLHLKTGVKWETLSRRYLYEFAYVSNFLLFIYLNKHIYLSVFWICAGTRRIDRCTCENPQIFLSGTKARKTYETDYQSKPSSAWKPVDLKMISSKNLCNNCQEKTKLEPFEHLHGHLNYSLTSTLF